jgi:hypothetical protein
MTMNKSEIVAHLRTPSMVDWLERANEKECEARAADPQRPVLAWTTRHRLTDVQREALPRLRAWSAIGFVHHVAHDTYALALHYSQDGQTVYGTLYPDGALERCTGSRTLELHLRHMRPEVVRAAINEHKMDPIDGHITYVERDTRFTRGPIKSNPGWDV